MCIIGGLVRGAEPLPEGRSPAPSVLQSSPAGAAREPSGLRTDRRRGRWLLANGFDDQADEVFGSFEQVLVERSVIGPSSAVGPVGEYVLDGRLEPIEPVVQSPEIVVGNHRLTGRQGEGGGPAAGFVGPLSMGRRAVAPGTPRPRRLVDGTLTPSAPGTLA